MDTNMIAAAARLLRENAEELKQSHTIASSGVWPEGESQVKAVYDEHLSTAKALESMREKLQEVSNPKELPAIDGDTRRELLAGLGFLTGHGYKGSAAALQRLLDETQEGTAEIDALRNVYEMARGVLRHDGIDKERAERYLSGLKDAIEEVKLIDSGLWEKEDSPQAPDAGAIVEKLPRYAYGYKGDDWGMNVSLRSYQSPDGAFLRRDEVIAALTELSINSGIQKQVKE